jgi:hypothetical protein
MGSQQLAVFRNFHLRSLFVANQKANIPYRHAAPQLLYSRHGVSK